MPALPTLPKMPMGIAAEESTDTGPTLPPLGMPPSSAQAPAMPPLSAGLPPMAAAAPAAPPAPAGLPQVPFQSRQQPDGSVAFYVPSPDGNPANDVVIGVAPAPKVPKAFAAPPAPAQPQQPPMQ